jgi:hypothetical protein
MPVIKPVSDLKNYTEVLRDIGTSEPVFLTKKGSGKSVIFDMEDCLKTQTNIRLMTELAKGQKSGESEGWKTIEDVEAALGIV